MTAALDQLPDRCLRLPEVQQLVRFSRMHIHRLEKSGKFPPRIHIGENRVVWRLSEIMAWLEAKQADKKKAA